MRETSTESKWSVLSLTLFLGIAVAFFIYMRFSGHEPEEVVDIIGEAGLVPFMGAMVLLPLLGFPVTPFYLLGGASFGNIRFLIAVSISLTFNLGLAYYLGGRILSPLFARSKWKVGDRALELWQSRHCRLFIFLIRIGPGTVNMKDYLLGALRAPFKDYFLVSWPLCMLYAVGFIVLGDSIINEDWWGIVIGITLILFLSVSLYLLKSFYRDKNKNDEK